MAKKRSFPLENLARSLNLDRNGPDIKGIKSQEEASLIVDRWYSEQCIKINESYKRIIDSSSIDNLHYLIQERYDQLKSAIDLSLK